MENREPNVLGSVSRCGRLGTRHEERAAKCRSEEVGVNPLFFI